MGAPGKFCNPGIVCGLQREAACLSAVGIRDRVAVSGAHTARAVRVAQDLVSEGADAFLLLWKRIPEYKFLYNFFKLPIIFNLFSITYEIVAFFLYIKNKKQLKKVN